MVSYRGRRSKILTATGLSGRWRSYTTTPRQIVIAWLLARLPSILPIPSTGSVLHLEDNMAAAAIELAPADVISPTGGTR